MSAPLDWPLLARYALLVSLSQLIPVPLLDSGVENLLRRRLVRRLLDAEGVQLSAEELAVLADASSGGCLGCVWSVLVWPLKKLLRTVLIVLQVKAMADVASEVVHRGLLLHEAVEAGWLPGDVQRVRAAMDTALAKVDTRPVERSLRGVFRDHTHTLNRAIYEATKLARSQDAEARGDALVEVAGKDEGLTTAMRTALQAPGGLVPELVQWFRHEMEQELPLPDDAG